MMETHDISPWRNQDTTRFWDRSTAPGVAGNATGELLKSKRTRLEKMVTETNKNQAMKQENVDSK
jgi:hypothetical protein